MDPIAGRLANFTYSLSIEGIPAPVIDAVSMYLADTLACAVAAAAEPEADAVGIVVAQAARDRHDPAATVLGTDWKTSIRSASLANCTMARYIDANDIYMPRTGSLSGSGHFSDAIPALVAAAEACGASGQELLSSLVIAYEVQAALAESFPWLDRGFHSVSQVTIAVALAAGKLMSLKEQQLAHAASLAVTSGLFVQSWLHPSDNVPSIKGGAPGLAAERGITCAELAGRGFTGPLDAFERFFEFFGADLSAPRTSFDRLGQEWLTSRNAIKPVPAQIYTQAVVQCARQLYDQGLRLDDMERAVVRSNDGACGRVQGSPGAFKPASREAADHSTPFVAAMTLRDGNLSPASYHGEPWRSPELIEAMSRIELVIDEQWTAKLSEQSLLGAEIEARDQSGKRYSGRVEQFRGHPDNRLSRDELIQKLEGFVGRPEVVGSGAGQMMLERCEALANGGSVEELIKRCRLAATGGKRGSSYSSTSSEY